MRAGGIPVVRGESGRLRGVEAVIDKDLVSASVARDLHADVLLLLTDVSGAFTGYGTPEQHLLPTAPVKQLRSTSFSDGSMGPKVEAACRFVEAAGARAVIGNFDEALGFLVGTCGTTVTV